MQTATRSPRLAPLKAILAKLDPKPQAQPLPPSPIKDRPKPPQAASPKERRAG
jgi:hypothetical protein